MTKGKDSRAAIAFKKRGGAYRGSAPLSDLALLRNDPAETMSAVTDVYRRALRQMRQWQRDIKSLRKSKIPLPASKAWELGNVVHTLNADLAAHGCRLENLYDHLERHAGLSPKWLGRFVTFRRYVYDVEAIPDGLKWNRVVRSAKSTGQAITAGLLVKF